MSGEVVALDPVRLAHLEAFLATFADGCHRRAVRIEEELAGTGSAAPGAVAHLLAVARWSAEEHREVAWRRAAVEALGEALPLTRIDLDAEMTEAEVDALATSTARRLAAALADRPPSWPRLQRLLTEVDRRLGSPRYAAMLLRALGPVPARDLALRVEEAVRAHVGWDRTVPPEDAAAYVAAQVTAARLVDVGTEAPVDEGGVSDAWLRRFMGLAPTEEDEPPPGGHRRSAEEVARIVGGLGAGARLSAVAARALELGRAHPLLGVGGAVLGLVSTSAAAADDAAVDPRCGAVEWGLGLAAAGSGVAAVLTPKGPWTMPLAGFAFLARQAARWVGERCDDDEEDEPGRWRPDPPGPGDRADAGTGVPVHPGGGPDRPHQDGAGGVLPPTMTRGPG